jgi:hypothetical protein
MSCRDVTELWHGIMSCRNVTELWHGMMSYRNVTALYFTHIVKAALKVHGHDSDVVQNLTGFGECGAALVQCPDVAKLYLPDHLLWDEKSWLVVHQI